MKTSLWLRIASILTLLYCAGHAAGMPWTPAQGPGEVTVLEAMKSLGGAGLRWAVSKRRLDDSICGPASS